MRAKNPTSGNCSRIRTGASSISIQSSASGPTITPISLVRSCAICAGPTRGSRRGSEMPSERFEFPNARGEKLAALLDRPGAEPVAYALFAHCFTCGKDVLAAKRIAEGLTMRGIAVLRFDFTGLGASEGEFANTNFSSNLEDLVAAADFMRTTYQAPRLLIGHSLGGAAVLAAASEMAEVKAVVTLAAPSHPGNVTEMFSEHLDEI